MAYYAIDSSGNLRHWKYIKRVRGKNGKWRYYYNRLTGRTDHKYWYQQNLTGTKKSAMDLNTGAKATWENGRWEYGFEGRPPRNAKIETKKTIFGDDKVTYRYKQQGKQYVTTFYMNPINKVQYMRTRDVTVDTNVERLVDKAKKKVNSWFD